MDNTLLYTYLELQNNLLYSKNEFEYNTAYKELNDFCKFCKKNNLADYENFLTK